MNTSSNSNSTSPISAISPNQQQQKLQNQQQQQHVEQRIQQRQTSVNTLFAIGELVWGSVRGYPAWPGKILNPPDGMITNADSAWVKWFGRKPNIELISVKDLKSLSEGLDAHHKAQKDIRK